MHKGNAFPIAFVYNKTYTGKHSFPSYDFFFIGSNAGPTTATLNINQDDSKLEGFSIASGICMVFLLMIVTAIIFSAFNVLLRRNSRRTRPRRLQIGIETRGLHRHLPITCQYSDQPPSYAAMQSCTLATTSTGHRDRATTISNVNVVSKIEDDETIAVRWSCSDNDTEARPQLIYPCVVIENAFNSTVDEEEPPSYQNCVDATYSH